MNKAVEIFMEEAVQYGQDPKDVRAMVTITAENELNRRYHKAKREMESALSTATVEELQAIVKEMQEGGEQ